MNNSNYKLSFNPYLATKKLLSGLDERPKKVIEERFGLVSLNPRTLESIGEEYNITRERVRQIEAFALNKIRQHDNFSRMSDFFSEIKENIDERGGLVKEESFLDSFSKKDGDRHHLYFLLIVGNPFTRMKEDEHFHHSWTTDTERAGNIRETLARLHKDLDAENIFSEKDIIAAFEKHLYDVLKEKIEEKVLLSLLENSRIIGMNALGEWGHSSSPYIKPRGMRDYAFLVMRKHGSPMHFSEVAEAIKNSFGRPAHVQTVHNELIKDLRFVLVGRGLYALKDWGYEGGVVRDVIFKVLSGNEALSKDDIVKKVLKERYVKENTILVNLQNNKYFKKDNEGNYSLI